MQLSIITVVKPYKVMHCSKLCMWPIGFLAVPCISPVTVDVDIDFPKRPLAAVKELSLGGYTLKLDLIVIIHFLSHCLYLDVRVETEYAPHTVFLLKIHLYNMHPNNN